ncbi:MAG: DNA cytosine methyltransferase [Oligoflexia bacterium]|nr:DNA cytosine methyltransferase [Oligoflexia bacterium]
MKTQLKFKNIVSLFDGMSCAQIVLNQLGISYEKYFASEIHKHSITITQDNYPNTIQLGDVREVDGYSLGEVDFIFAGSPCQGFSRNGKKLQFKDDRSKLIFEFIRIYKEVNPKYFFLENVSMNKEAEDYITNFLGVAPIVLDSALVSAQSRKRLYWTNVPYVGEPQDRKMFIKDILIEELNHKEELIESAINYPPHHFGKNYLQWDVSGKGHRSQQYRAYYPESKHGCLAATRASDKCKVLLDREKMLYRKLDPIECERLQGVPDNYTKAVSRNQRINILGNGWNIPTVKHLLKGLDLYDCA